MALNKILVQVGGKGVNIGAGLENCLTKFDKNQLRYRRAFSMNAKCVDINHINPWDEDYGSEMFDVKEYIRERRYSWELNKIQLA